MWLVLRTEKTKKDLMTMMATINQSLTIDRTMQYDPTKIRDTGDHIITDNHTMDMMIEVTKITKVIGVVQMITGATRGVRNTTFRKVAVVIDIIRTF